MTRTLRSLATLGATAILSLALGTLALTGSADARAAKHVRSTLKSGGTLAPGKGLRSPNRQYRLVMQRSDGNLVLYKGKKAVWNAGPAGKHARAVMRKSGNLVVLRRSKAKWTSGSAGFHGAKLVLQDDGNLVIYQRSHAIWTYGGGYIGDTLLSGATLAPGAYLKSPDRKNMLVMQSTDGNLVLYGPSGALWDFGTTGHPGAFAAMQGDGNFVVYQGGQAVKATDSAEAGSFLRVQDDGNLVIYKDATAVWDRVGGLVGPSGPSPFPNPGIADHAEQRADGTSEGQCLVFVTNVIVEAGGPRYYFGDNTDTYQSQWAQRAVEIGSIAHARRGDIIQWGGGAGGNLLHTAIVTTPGSDPSLIDSNWENDERVHRGPFSSRNRPGSVYRIWRVGKP